MAESGVIESEWVDPRIRRTRRMLLEALERLLERKSIEQIAVGDIAGQAGLNRATFYDHYPDKFSLLEGLVESRFEDLLSQRGVAFDGTCGAAVQGIIRVTCEYLAGLPRTDCPGHRQMEKHLETAVMSVVQGMIVSGMRAKHPMREHDAEVPMEMVAATIAGAIYGGAREWVLMPRRAPVESATEAIFRLLRPMMEAAEGALA